MTHGIETDLSSIVCQKINQIQDKPTQVNG